jgi:hypothetical protein
LPWLPKAFGQQGAIGGTVVDTSGAPIARAQVRLSLDGRGPDREMQSADSGEFSFQNVAADPYRLSFTAAGFASKTMAGELHAGETLNLPLRPAKRKQQQSIVAVWKRARQKWRHQSPLDFTGTMQMPA